MKLSFILSIAAVISVALAQEQPERNTIAKPIDSSENVSTSHNRAFTAWSSPGYKGHRQQNKGTRGCYKMDGGAVGSFEGSDDYQYGFYNDDSCRRKFLFGASSASIKRIDPIIYPRSVKIWKNDGPPRLDPNQYTAVFWTRSHFGGERKKFTGMGCYDLDGSTIRSIQGTMRYKFYDGPRCYGGRVAEYVGPKNNIRISPKSVYIN
ncbi:hypothetical protein BGZ59_007312 [Podila verticillata]|nr:hypothetical protein BGZ59_007312 [Podila verticillata]KFH71483.1 hypothetical protein MVEG_01782 [Podila verticillata NRRL 6337]